MKCRILGLFIESRLGFLGVKMKNEFMARIISHPDLRGGEPCIKGTRIPVSMIVANVAQGLTRQDIIREYPQLRDEDITAALMYASESVHQESIYALGA
jgi:uncharacterized protein (DUF433 family)